MLSRLSRWWRHARAAASQDDGITLTELIVAMTLSVILGAVTMTMFVNVSNSSASTTDRTIGANQARSVLQAWSIYLHVADGPTAAGSSSHRFEWITPTSMLFYADLGNRQGGAGGTGPATPPTMIWLRLDTAQQLVEEQFTSSSATYPGTYGTAYSTCRILADHVTSTTFTGYASTGSGSWGSSLAPTGAGCLALTGSVSQTDPTANSALPNVTSVGIDFTVIDLARTHTQEYSSVITLPALGGGS